MYNVVSDTLGKLSVAELGLTKFKKPETVAGISYNIGTESLYPASFMIYQGAQLPSTAKHASLLLPTCLYTEKIGTYLNLQGIVRVSKIVTTPYRHTLTDVEVFKLLTSVRMKLYPDNFSVVEKFDDILGKKPGSN